MFEIYQKRQAYRLQIRSRHIKQLLGNARKKYLAGLRSEREQHSTLHRAQNRQIKFRLVDQLNDLLNKIWENKNNNRWSSVLADVDDWSIKMQELKNMHNDIAYDLLSLSVDEILHKNGEHVVKLVHKQMSQDECLGSTQQEEEFNGEEGDNWYEVSSRQQKQREQQKHEHIENRTQQIEIKEVQLQIVKVCSIVLQKVKMELMSRESCVWMIKLLWGMLQQSADIYSYITRQLNSNCDDLHNAGNRQKYRYTYMSIITTILSIFCTCTQAGTAQRICWQTLQELGLLSKVSQLIQYGIEYDTLFKHQLSEVNGREHCSIKQLHMGITQILVAFHRQFEDHIQAQTQAQTYEESPDIELHLYEHYAAYGLYLLDTLSTLSHGTHIQLRISAVQMLELVLRANTRLIASIEQANYATLMHLLQVEATSLVNYYEDKPSPSASDQIEPKCTIASTHQMIKQVLRLFSTICDSNQTTIYIVVEQYHIVDTVYDLLSTTIDQLKSVRPQIDAALKRQMQDLLQQLTNLIIILLDTNKKSIKAILYTHKIWPCIFNFQSQHPMLSVPLFQLYQHFFMCFGKKVIFKYMPVFLDNVIKFNINCYYEPKMNLIRNVIKNVYQYCQTYLNQIEMEEISNMFESYGIFKNFSQLNS